MKTFFIDTNLFVRYLTNDDPEKAEKVERLLAEAKSGSIGLVTAEMVIAELIWVLESAYGLKNSQIAPMIKAILATPGLKVTNASLVAKSLEFYEAQHVDFVDGYLVALMEKMGISEIFSFDKKHISRITRVKRVEP
jgi:uncharacterized protein